jgi:hypothetical protein
VAGPLSFYPPIEGKADVAITQALYNLRNLVQKLQVQAGSSTQFLTRAEAEQRYGPANIKKMLQTGGAYFLNVHDLPGVLAQPQNAGAATGTATPSVLSPLSQNGTLFIVTPGISLYFFDGSSSPGTWKAVTATAIGHNILSITHTDTLAGAVARGAIIVGNSTPKWASLSLGGSGNYLRSNGTDLVYATIPVADLPAHNVLSATHGDTLTGSVVRGDLIVGNATPKWARVALGGSGTYLRSNATDASWSALTATDLSGTVAVANGGTAGTTLADGPNIKHGRVTTGSINAATHADVTLNWSTNFADTSYTVSATVEDTSAAGLGLTVDRIRSKAAGSVVVQVFNQAVGALTGTLDVIAIHD